MQTGSYIRQVRFVERGFATSVEAVVGCGDLWYRMARQWEGKDAARGGGRPVSTRFGFCGMARVH
eukprot:11167315-Lingulodinium_polyedra.AAC.1